MRKLVLNHSGAVGEGLRGMALLEHITINYCRSLRPDALAGATALTRLEAMRLSEAQLGLLDGVRTRLRALELYDCPIGDDALRDIPRMEHLLLCRTPERLRGTHVGAMTGL